MCMGALATANGIVTDQFVYIAGGLGLLVISTFLWSEGVGLRIRDDILDELLIDDEEAEKE